MIIEQSRVRGLSVLTYTLGMLGSLADQFECHAASRSIDDIEAAGRAMRAAKYTIEQLMAAIETTLDENAHLADGEVCTLLLLKIALRRVGKPWDGDLEATYAPGGPLNPATDPRFYGLPAYHEGDVVGPCVCGSWPGGKCPRQTSKKHG
jgi:hypothetical protein